MINTRQEIINALNEAAEIEHSFMIQYLFTAFTLKKRITENVSAEQIELIRSWESSLLRVAREEMTHLGTVCNLLSAVGGSPHFNRLNFPQMATPNYPFSIELSRLSDETLYRFIRFELPRGEPLPSPPLHKKQALSRFTNLAPDPLEYEYLGQLYGKIRHGFNSVAEDELFVGPKASQDFERWSNRMVIIRVTDRKSANEAIDFIIEMGEGSPDKREGSHYDTFLKMRSNLNMQIQQQKDFDPSRPVVSNPRTRRYHQDAPSGGTLIQNADSKRVAEFFNISYEISLLMLTQLYFFGGETIMERDGLRQASRQLMTTTLRPTAEILTEMPLDDELDNGNAGPPFEIYGDFQFATQESARWTILNERLESIISESKDLISINKRFQSIFENLSLIRDNINNVLRSEEKL